MAITRINIHYHGGADFTYEYGTDPKVHKAEERDKIEWHCYDSRTTPAQAIPFTIAFKDPTSHPMRERGGMNPRWTRGRQSFPDLTAGSGPQGFDHPVALKNYKYSVEIENGTIIDDPDIEIGSEDPGIGTPPENRGLGTPPILMGLGIFAAGLLAGVVLTRKGK